MKNKISKELYCQFLIAAQNNFTMTAMADLLQPLSHDKINRWAGNVKLTAATLWEYAKYWVERKPGYLIGDDVVLEKEYGGEIALTSKQYSASDGKFVNGIGLTSLIWSDGDNHIPLDYRIYSKVVDGKTKNDHLREMLKTAKARGLQPKAVLLDCWYASVNNLKAINSFGWIWITEIKKNRIINHNQHLEDIAIPKEGIVVHLRAYGWVKVIKRAVNQNDHLGYLATNDLTLSADAIARGYAERWQIEEYHRGLKQTTGIEECQARVARIQRNHIFCSVLAFLTLEVKRITDGTSWYQAKYSIVKDAIRIYLKSPTIYLDYA